MNRIKKIIRQEHMYIITSILVGFLFYGTYLIPHVSTDGYWWLQNAGSVDPFRSLKLNGRFCRDIVAMPFNLLKIYPIHNQEIFICISILIFSFIAFGTYYIIKNKCVGISKCMNIILFMSVLGIYFNTFFTDWFAWTEVIIFMHIPAMLLAILSGIELNKIENRYRYLVSGVLLIIAFGFYQAVGFYFFFIHTIFILCNYLEEKSFKKSIIKIVESFCIFVIAAISQLIIAKIFNIARANYGSTDFIGNIYKIIKSSCTLWIYNLNTMPKYVYLILFGISIITILYVTKRRWGLRLLIFILFIGLMSILMVPHVIGNTFWLVARTTTGFMALPFWLLIMGIIVYNTAEQRKYSLMLMRGLVIPIAIFMGISYYQVQLIGTDLHTTNFIEEKEVAYFYDKIIEYEKTSGNKISNIGFTRDASYSYSYPGIIAYGDTNMRGFTNTWSRMNMFNYYTNRMFNEVEVPEEIIEQHFEGNNWVYLSEEQIVFNNDTAYICIY